MNRRWCVVLLALAGFSLTGCADLQELKINFRNRYLASEAWDALQETYGCMNYETDFGRGFRAGYYDVASGGNGCPPILPPERYWSARYMNTTGRARTEAWFSGFRYGAMVAEQDGVGIFIELPTSLPPKEKRHRASSSEEEVVPTEAVPTETAPNDAVPGEETPADAAPMDGAPMDPGPAAEPAPIKTVPPTDADSSPLPDLPEESPTIEPIPRSEQP